MFKDSNFWVIPLSIFFGSYFWVILYLLHYHKKYLPPSGHVGRSQLWECGHECNSWVLNYNNCGCSIWVSQQKTCTTLLGTQFACEDASHKQRNNSKLSQWNQTHAFPPRTISALISFALPLPYQPTYTNSHYHWEGYGLS